jgi:hypothetical protein
MDPTPQEVATLTSIDAVCNWAELQGDLTSGPRGSLYHALGCTGTERPRVIAMMDATDFADIAGSLLLTSPDGSTKQLTPTQASQVGLVGRACKVV